MPNTTEVLVCKKCAAKIPVQALQGEYKCCPECREPDLRYWDEPQWSSDFFPTKDEQG